MQFALLIYESPEAFAARKSDGIDPYTGAWRPYHKALIASGAYVAGEPLEVPETATTVRVKDGKRGVQDGPFAYTKEQLAGFIIMELPSLDQALDWWEGSQRRRLMKERLREADGVDADEVIMDADAARRRGLASTAVFPVGNLAPRGSVVKATAIDPSVVGPDDVYRHRGPVRVFTSEAAAVAAIKGRIDRPVKAGDVLVLAPSAMRTPISCVRCATE